MKIDGNNSSEGLRAAQSVEMPQNNKIEFSPNHHPCHLLITTRRRILAWDEDGVHTILESRREGIVAVKQARDGSGLLAVASRNTVIMHDPKRGRESSWGLNADKVRRMGQTSGASQK